MRRVATFVFCSAFSMGPAMADGRLGGGLLEYLIEGGTVSSPRTTVPARLESTQVLGGTFIAPAIGGGPRYEPPALPQIASIAPSEPTATQTEIAPQYMRQEVAYDGTERPGVIIVDTPDKYLLLVEPNGRAIRYGIGVGRPGFEWAGVMRITRKAEWPGWTPPSQMVLRRPDLPAHMDGGPGNPLGARALFLGSSLYRIHGTNEPWSIGQNVSSGCIRMMNEDVIDLYNRVRIGTKVIVM